MHKAQRLLRAADLVKAFETFQPLAVRRPDGGWAIGYGHTRAAREHGRVSVEDAEALLLYDLMQVAEVVDRDVEAPLEDHQREAVVAFAFNIGWRAFSNSPVVERLNADDMAGAAEAIGRWNCTQVDGEPQLVDALVQRRAAETLRLLSPPNALLSSSTPLTAPTRQAEPSAPVRPFAPSADTSGAVEVAILSGSPADRLSALDAPVDEFMAVETAEDEPLPPPIVDAPIVDPVVAETSRVEKPVAGTPLAEAWIADATRSHPPAAAAIAPVATFAPAPAPVPFPAPRTEDAPAVPSAPPPVSPPSAGTQVSESAGAGSNAGARIGRRRLRGRAVGLALGLVGGVLFLGALGLIVAGPASAWKLLAGLVGVLILTPGAYLLFGPRTPSTRP